MNSSDRTDESRTVELSVVMPCLNEADTVAACIIKAQRALREADIVGEIIVADNGSTDASREIAKSRFATDRITFCTPTDLASLPPVDLAYCNGVFHHIPLAARDEAIRSISRVLRPGGFFALWENNPLNPGTRYVMRRIPFDRDAITLTSATAANLVRKAGFQVVATDFLFIFPRPLGWLRVLEPWVARLPLGAQYQVLCRKP